MQECKWCILDEEYDEIPDYSIEDHTVSKIIPFGKLDFQLEMTWWGSNMSAELWSYDREVIDSIKMEGFKYCPYCGRKLEIKEDALNG